MEEKYKVTKVCELTVRRDLKSRLTVEDMGCREAPEGEYWELPLRGYYFSLEGCLMSYDPEKLSYEEAKRLIKEEFVARQLQRLSRFLADLSEFLVDPEEANSREQDAILMEKEY